MNCSFLVSSVFALAFAGGLVAAQDCARPDLVAKVSAGELKEARASWWGWNGEDDTAALQSAIDSGVSRLVVDRVPGSWVVRPLYGRSNQTVVFEKGVEVLAKKGEFTGIYDSLFSYRNATNVTLSGYGAVLRMHRMDYHNPPYRKAEWRHGLNLLSCSDFRIEGLEISQTGGDGIYIGNTGKGAEPCRNVTIIDCVCDRNYRQGISVISADGLLIENTVMKNTWGTPPAAGIDLEPNRPSEVLRRCVLRNCVSSGNQGNGYEIYLGPLVATSAPVGILFDNCRSSGNGRSGFHYANHLKRTGDFPTGRIALLDCTFEREAQSGIYIANKPTGSVRIGFRNCSLEDCCAESKDFADVRFSPPESTSCDNVRFLNLTVKQSAARNWLSGMETSWKGKRVADVRGNVTVRDPSGNEREIVLDEKWLYEAQGARPDGMEFCRRDFSAAGMEVVDRAPGKMIDLQPVRARYGANYIFCVEKARRVNLDCRIWNYGGDESAKSVEVLDMSGKSVARVEAPPAKQWGEVSFDVPAGGFYRVVFGLANSQGCELRRADVPVALEGGEKGQFFIGTPAKLYVHSEGGEPFAMQATGSGEAEPVHVVFRDPSGKVRLDRDNVCSWAGYAEKAPGRGLWTVEVARACRGRFEDFGIDVLTQPCILFLSEKRYWRSVR